MRKREGFSAWIVTSEGTAPLQSGTHNVVDILDPRLSPERVREIVEILNQREDSLCERVAWRLQKRRQPYPAEFVKIDGVPWKGQVICGHNPFFVAQLVDNLTIEVDADGREKPVYTVRKTVAQATEEIRRKHRARF